jgi:hypothetical protein
VATESPFGPGESPFRTKGNVYRALLESADARVPGGREAVLARIDDPALAKFFAQPFLAASAYDIQIEGRFTSERAYEATASGIPRPLVVWLMNVAYGFVPVVMESAGARDVQIAIHMGELEREQGGVALMRSSFAVTWKS